MGIYGDDRIRNFIDIFCFPFMTLESNVGDVNMNQFYIARS